MMCFFSDSVNDKMTTYFPAKFRYYINVRVNDCKDIRERKVSCLYKRLLLNVK